MKAFANKLKSLWKDESAQGATEYILLVVVIVGIIMIFKGEIRATVESKIQELKGAIAGVGTGG